MTKTAGVARLQLPRLFGYQQEFADAPEARKQANWGRRTGKTRADLNMGVNGHGPLMEDEQGPIRAHPGLMHGRNVLWVGLDYKQIALVWNEEIEPRWSAAGLRINKNDMEAYFPRADGKGDCKLIFRSSENPNAIRGAGKNLGGVILDEAAHYDAESILEDVLRPVLLDEDAWLILTSTPNAGPDYHLDDVGNKVTPSYFNRLATAILAGDKPRYHYSHADARLNPKISARAWEALIDEYPEGSLKLRQEVFAELLTGGVGFAFPELRKDLHQAIVPEVRGELFVGLDWGYGSHGWIGVFLRTKRGCHLLWEFVFNGKTHMGADRYTPAALAAHCAPVWGRYVREGKWPAIPGIVYADSQMDALTEGAESTLKQFANGLNAALGENAPLCVPAPKGPGSRVSGKMALHSLLKYKEITAEDGMRVVVDFPRFTVDPRCAYWWASVSGLPLDPKDPEDVDTASEDHGYDGTRYAIISEFPDLAREPSKIALQPPIKDALSRKAAKEYDDLVAREIARINQGRRGGGRHYG